jgi:hypothetical protein
MNVTTEDLKKFKDMYSFILRRIDEYYTAIGGVYGSEDSYIRDPTYENEGTFAAYFSAYYNGCGLEGAAESLTWDQLTMSDEAFSYFIAEEKARVEKQKEEALIRSEKHKKEMAILNELIKKHKAINLQL